MTDKKELKKEEVETVERKEVVVVKERQDDFALMPAEQIKKDLVAIKQFQDLVRSQMVKDHDYGIIPGTQKPTLLKPGAEKIAKLMRCADLYEIISEVEDWDKPFFAYKVRCRLVSIMNSSKILSEGLGACNSYESKYRHRWAFGNEVPEDLDKATLKTKKVHSQKTNKDYLLYRIENDDVFTQVNTFLKMAKKRALVDASLSAGRLSDIFTQDMEDIKPQTSEQKPPVAKPVATPAKAAPAKQAFAQQAVTIPGDILSQKLGFGKYGTATWGDVNLHYLEFLAKPDKGKISPQGKIAQHVIGMRSGEPETNSATGPESKPADGDKKILPNQVLAVRSLLRMTEAKFGVAPAAAEATLLETYGVPDVEGLPEADAGMIIESLQNESEFRKLLLIDKK